MYGKDESDVRRKLQKLLAELEPPDDQRTLNHLLDYWLDSADIRETTRRDYAKNLQAYVRDELGRVLLSELSPEHLQTRYNEMKARGLTRKPHYVHRLLFRALKLGVRWGWIPENPAERVAAPKWQPEPRPVWDEDELDTFVAGTRDHWLYPLWALLLTAGLRLSEAGGLQWDDVDGDTLHVRRTLRRSGGEWVEGKPKTKSSRRRITLSSEATEALRIQREQQAGWGVDGASATWVFTAYGGASGAPLSHGSVQHALKDTCEALGITHLTPHDLRHMHASLLLAEGVPVPVVSRRLGHANAQITMSVYAHALPNQDQVAADAISEALT